MTKDKNIKIKLELYKENSGNMGLIIHFNKDSSNVILEDGEYLWMPTVEEKEIINESFALVNNSGKNFSQSEYEERKEITPKLESERIKPELEPEPEKEPLSKKDVEPEKPAVFKVTEEHKNPSFDEEIPEPPREEVSKTPDKTQEKPKETGDEKKMEDAIIVEADSDAIEAALKKHQKKDEDDDSIVEADEKTIIDKVLKQKKKGKWSKK